MKLADRVIRQFLLTSVPDGARVLDVGCGSGWAAMVIARECPGCTVHGADTDATVVHRVNRRGTRRRGPAQVRCFPCAAEDLLHCFGRARYDVAVSVHALHHYADPFEALRNMHGILQPGGRALIAEYEPWYGEGRDDCPRFSLDKIVALCDEAGFDVTAAGEKRPGILLVAAERAG